MRSRSGKVRLKSTPEQLRRDGVLLDESLAEGSVDLAALFDNDHPVELEVGPGKGAFLLRRARERPEINFLGVEWVRAYAWYVADRARRGGLTNVRTLCADAEALFRRGLPDRSVQRVHIYFPDPWPKRKHRRRRLVKVPFLADVRRVLRLGGGLALVTDDEDYFRQMRLAVAVTDGLAVQVFSPASGAWLVDTNFERKYAAEGKRFFATQAVRYR
ncbi:MAG: tRNA (guanosine(46)-N7)-methyltransferase TrmB [Planctomycetota bacterium]|jgi:tRNA (guanine-N7-)-methyltransferase